MLLTPGQTNDSPLLPPPLDAVAVPRLDGGPPRRNPDVVIADRAYSAASNRTLLRRKRIQTVIPERRDQVANRKRKGRAGGRAPSFDTETYKRRNVVERAFNNACHSSHTRLSSITKAVRLEGRRQHQLVTVRCLDNLSAPIGQNYQRHGGAMPIRGSLTR